MIKLVAVTEHPISSHVALHPLRASPLRGTQNVAIHPDHTATISAGYAELCQGRRTSLRQVAAEKLDPDLGVAYSRNLRTEADQDTPDELLFLPQCR